MRRCYGESIEVYAESAETMAELLEKLSVDIKEIEDEGLYIKVDTLQSPDGGYEAVVYAH